MLSRKSPADLLRGVVLLALLLLGALSQSVYAQEIPLRYVSQPGTPVSLPNFVQPDQACKWAGVGGQVFDLSGQPQSGLIVQVEGQIQGQSVLLYSVTGGNSQFGPGGYLIKIANSPLASQGRLFLQVVDIAGTRISERIQLNTVADCNGNLLLVNVFPIEFSNPIYLPAVGR